ncbi:MAG: aminoacyl-tRNA hydrolase [Candidatus Vogelbacteria bacterium]|nr:aminoacyl-tRNA hydrolase [Candidatus Vogelbacteria bacterium]
MIYTIVGLGNPDEQYAKTRHNVGRMALESYRAARPEFSDWHIDPRRAAQISEGAMHGLSVMLVLPQTSMNLSGDAVRRIVSGDFDGRALVVCHDDIDVPFGSIKISFDRGSAGHRGVQSIIDALATNAFCRIRIGLAPTDDQGVAHKPLGKDAVEQFVLGRFSAREAAKLPVILRRTAEAIDTIIEEGLSVAMNRFNKCE